MTIQNDANDTEPQADKRKENNFLSLANWKLKLASVLLSLSLLLTILWWIGKNVTLNGQSLNQLFFYRAYNTYTNVAGAPEIGIYRHEDTKGWAHAPSTSGRHFMPSSFDVTYHIDEKGNRRTNASYDLPKILFVGCSITFGYGIEDDSTFVSILESQLPGYKMVNTCVSGYGTGQAYLDVMSNLKQYDDIRMVVYPFINHHSTRNYLRKSWLKFLDERLHPHFEVENDKLTQVGMADPEKDAIEDTLLLNKKEAEITFALVKAMQDSCAARQIPFLLVHLPDDWTESMNNLVKPIVAPANYLDLQPSLDLNTMKHLNDSHPNGKGHRLIAEQLLPFLRNHLSALPTK